MSLVAPIEDGKLIQNGASTTEKTKDGSKLDKDSFLQLLVAQMKYQDPLEPTSNTEYISQYAQFSQVESLQSMSNNMDLQRASSLVGEQVYMKTATASGETKYVYGKVDYVTYEGGQAYLFINENRYPLSELETIVDSDYYKAYNMATDLVTSLNKLPAVGAIGLSDGEAIDALQKTYDSMTDYQKSFVSTSKTEALKAYTDKIAELRKLAKADKGST
ncbi:MAG TPA: flagellar hook capping FlgD N-terminal domain-containing protein [Lachnospiraceae bacterium]|nr:flagellar hook capping FlgD N-terminal domain-containing protein [Lachnospiraceae bacterium]